MDQKRESSDRLGLSGRSIAVKGGGEKEKEVGGGVGVGDGVRGGGAGDRAR